mgnify:CR=1 FL=1
MRQTQKTYLEKLILADALEKFWRQLPHEQTGLRDIPYDDNHWPPRHIAMMIDAMPAGALQYQMKSGEIFTLDKTKLSNDTIDYVHDFIDMLLYHDYKEENF